MNNVKSGINLTALTDIFLFFFYQYRQIFSYCLFYESVIIMFSRRTLNYEFRSQSKQSKVDPLANVALKPVVFPYYLLLSPCHFSDKLKRKKKKRHNEHSRN